MTRIMRMLVLLAAAALAASGPALDRPGVGGPDVGGVGGVGGVEGATFSVLVFSRTTTFRHPSIPAGVTALREIGAESGFAVDATEDPAAFTDERLARYTAVIFLSTTGDVLDAAQQAAFERYVRAGGGYVGIHAASDTEYDWPWYGRLVGAYFRGHPHPQDATVVVEDRRHVSTAFLPERWWRYDEWYDYREDPRGRVHVLLTLDEATYEGGGMGADHPIAWCHEFDGGRAWYTGGGHTDETFAEPLFRRHLLGGILWAAGREEAEGAETDPGDAAGRDAPGPGAAPDKLPRRIRAEHAWSHRDVRRVRSDDADDGGLVVAFDKDGAFVSYRPVFLRGVRAIALRIAPGAAGSLELRAQGPDGPLLGRAVIASRTAWTDIEVPVSANDDARELFVIDRTGTAVPAPLTLSWLELRGTDP